MLLPAALSSLSFRKLARNESGRYVNHLRRLHPDDLRDRYMGPPPARLETSFEKATVVIGCFVGRKLRGSAELHVREDGAEAELAVSVERSCHDRGIGTELVRRAIVLARNRLIARMLLYCLSGNSRMQRVIRKLGGKIDREQGSALGTIDCPPPTQATLALEQIGDSMAVVESSMSLLSRARRAIIRLAETTLSPQPALNCG